jgi:hypothetical protein
VKGLPPIRINIVEEAGWQPYDPGNLKGVLTWASDNAWDDWKNMSEETCQDLVEALLDAAFTRKERAGIGPEGISRICEELRENDGDELDATFHAIIDAHQWTWEEAYTPTDLDIEKAVDRAKGEWFMDARLSDYWNLALAREDRPKGPKEWSPRIVWTEAGLFHHLDEHIRYQRKREEYDRFIVFDWGDADPIVALLEAIKRTPAEGSREDVENELREWADLFMHKFFSALEDRMQVVDTAYRTDFDKHWKTMLSDKQTMGGVRRDLLEFLKQHEKKARS